jgi:REP element-mobilizing transposase RayT
MNRGARRQTIFLDDADRRCFVTLLTELDERFGVEVHLWCLVGNHFHLVVRSRDGRISDAMKFLSERFTRRSNDRHSHDGAIFRGRFHSVMITNDDHHRWLFHYVHQNATIASLEANAETTAKIIARAIVEKWGLSIADLHVARVGICSEPRLAFALVAVEVAGLSTAEVAQVLGFASPGACRSVVARARNRCRNNQEFSLRIADVILAVVQLVDTGRPA